MTALIAISGFVDWIGRQIDEDRTLIVFRRRKWTGERRRCHQRRHMRIASSCRGAAIQALQIASRYDLAVGGAGFIGRFGALYPTYVRGVAYLAARQPAEAAGEFQRILDHRSIVLVDPMDALARLQLARALTLSGETGTAKQTYDDLFMLWKNADPDIRILNEAQAEYASLP